MQPGATPCLSDARPQPQEPLSGRQIHRRCYLSWCAEHGLDPIAARRPHLELSIRWMQEIRRFSPPPSPGGSPSQPGSTGPASWTAPSSTHPPGMSAVPLSPPDHRPPVHAPAVRSPAHRHPGLGEPVRLRAGGHVRPARPADLRSHRRRHRRPRRGARPPGPARVRQGHQGRPGPAAARGRPGHRPGGSFQSPRADPAQRARRPDGPARGHPLPAAATRTTSRPPTWRPAPDSRYVSPRLMLRETPCIAEMSARPFAGEELAVMVRSWA